MNAIISILLNTIAVLVASSILPGIHIDNFLTAMIVAIVLGLVNTFIRPLIFLLTLPLNILTLGLFTFVILGFLVILVSWIVPGFHVDNFFWALAFALVMAIVNSFLNGLTGRRA